MCTLELDYAYTTHETPNDTDFPQVTVSSNGEYLLTYIKPYMNTFSDLPATVISLSTLCHPRDNIFTLTGDQLRAQSRYIIAVTASPSLKRVLVASVYQNYSDPNDPLNTFVVADSVDAIAPGVAGDFRHPVTLTLYQFDKCFTSWIQVAQRVVTGVYLLPRVFEIEWSTFDRRYVTLFYPQGPVVPPVATTTFNVEIVDTHSPSLKSSATGTTSEFGYRLVLFKLKDNYFIVFSGAATNIDESLVGPVRAYDKVVAVGPSGVFVLKVNFCDASITQWAFHALPVMSRMIDVRVDSNGDKAQFINTTRQAAVPFYHAPYPPGVNVPIIPSENTSSTQLFAFSGRKIKLVDDVEFNIPGGFAARFIPNSDLILTSYYLLEPSFEQLVSLKLEDGCLELDNANHPLAYVSRLSVSAKGNVVVASGFGHTESLFSAVFAPGINSIQIFLIS